MGMPIYRPCMANSPTGIKTGAASCFISLMSTGTETGKGSLRHAHLQEQRQPASFVVVKPVFRGAVHHLTSYSSSGTYCLTTVVLPSVHGLPLKAPSTQKKCSTSPGRISARYPMLTNRNQKIPLMIWPL